MGDYAPPSGPPPPQVPAGWKAQWNEQYHEWFFVNIYTKKSQWEKPLGPVYPPANDDDVAPSGPPPAYASKLSYGGSEKQSYPNEKGSGLGSNNPYGAGSSGPHDNVSEDERLARRLQQQEEEHARSSGSAHRGLSDDYYNQGSSGYGSSFQGPPYGHTPSPGPYGQSSGSPAPYGQQDLPPREQKKGLFGKLLGKSSSRPPQGQAYPPQGYPPQGYPPQGYPPQQGYYGQQPMYQQQQQPAKKHGLGAGGAAALGVGGGLLGGMMLGEALGDAGDGGDHGGDDGGDFGGDGGDF